MEKPLKPYSKPLNTYYKTLKNNKKQTSKSTHGYGV
jgi:hypothetical protein